MFPTQNESIHLLQDLSESYAVEVKRWFDLNDCEGKAKIIKASIALRNNGGGRLVIGFDDETMQPLIESSPEDVRGAFSQDEIQALVSRYASEPFEVLVQYVHFNDHIFPVICVPSGVRTPVATKADLRMPATGTPIVPINTVYVRTLSSNNTVSTAPARWRDWARLVEICFDNREADIGRFVRRHLNKSNFPNLVRSLSGLIEPATPDASQISEQWLGEGRQFFDQAVTRSNVTIPTVGYFEIGAVILGQLNQDLAANQSLLNLITIANRHLTGWPFFTTLHNAEDAERRPHVVADAWEASIFRPTNDPWGFNGIDFWRVQADGKLYAIRGFYEDFSDRVSARTIFSIVSAIRHVADAFAEVIAIAKHMVPEPSESTLAITLRWTGLEQRTLSNINSQRFWSNLDGVSIDSEALFKVCLPIDLPDSALAEQVGRAIAPLFRKFNGFELGQNVVDAEVRELLNV